MPIWVSLTNDDYRIMLTYLTTGRHHIRYAIMPHSGPLSPATVRTALNFNSPMKIQQVASPSSEPNPLLNAISLEGDATLILDTVKRGEDDEDVSRGEFKARPGKSIILRIYESLGGKSRGVIKTTLPIKQAFKTNVLEDDLGELTVKDQAIEIELRPFEVATFRLQL
jgi:alpha-mannosidase